MKKAHQQVLLVAVVVSLAAFLASFPLGGYAEYAGFPVLVIVAAMVGQYVIFKTSQSFWIASAVAAVTAVILDQVFKWQIVSLLPSNGELSYDLGTVFIPTLIAMLLSVALVGQYRKLRKAKK